MIGQARKVRSAAIIMPQTLVEVGAFATMNSQAMMLEKTTVMKKEISMYAANIIYSLGKRD
jgi:hypothetical protein